MTDAEKYNAVFLAALAGVTANPSILAESDANFRMARQMAEMGGIADAIARDAVKFVKD